MNLSSRVLITKVNDPVTAGTSVVTSSHVDLAGYKGALFVTSFGTANAGNLLHLEGSASTASTAFADLAGTEVNSTGGSDEDQFCEIHDSQYRYVRAAALRGASSTLGDIWCLRYSPSTLPVDNTRSGEIFGGISLAPSTGTK